VLSSKQFFFWSVWKKHIAIPNNDGLQLTSRKYTLDFCGIVCFEVAAVHYTKAQIIPAKKQFF
jgi:hypothetical protein